MIRRALHAYRLRWKRRRLLFRVWRKSGQLRRVAFRADTIKPDDILCFATVRNEMLRLPYFFDHYRALGVAHFLIVDNDSGDGTADYLAAQPDVSLWSSTHSYKLSRFGMDWLAALQYRFGTGHWCLTVDADEILVYPEWPNRSLPALARDLDAAGVHSFGAIMLDLYPKGPLSQSAYTPGDDPTKALPWFDAQIRRKPNPIFGSDWVQGGVRDRVFFGARPERAPTLNKVPFVRWDKPYVYVTSTHHMLPAGLNRVFETQGARQPSGVLLHTKFLNNIAEKSQEEMTRKEHFENADLYLDYYDALVDDPDFWHEGSTRYEGWAQLVQLDLMTAGKG